MSGVQEPKGKAADFDLSDEDFTKKLTTDCTSPEGLGLELWHLHVLATIGHLVRLRSKESGNSTSHHARLDPMCH